MEVTKIIIADKLVFSVTDLILFITLMAICWYAWETRKVKNEMVGQNELALCPIILVDLDTPRNNFVYENNGKGVALNIETEDVIIDKYPPKTFTFTFDQINHILAGEKKIVNTKVCDKQGNRMPVDIFFANFDPIVAESDFEIPIRYTDILGTPYETIMGCGTGGIRIIKFEKKEKGLISRLKKRLSC